MTVRILQGDCRYVLQTLPDESVHCVVTSPPYWGLRDYGVDGQIGLEPSPAEYAEQMAFVFREVRRVLRADGTLWLNIGDSYAGHNLPGWRAGNEDKNGGASNKNGVGYIEGMKPKDLIGIPWLLAFALRDAGWYLRQDIIWSKPNPMPESVRDRCTKAHEYLFLLSKSERYYFDATSIAEPAVTAGEARGGGLKVSGDEYAGGALNPQHLDNYGMTPESRNKRSVWTVATKPFGEAHFATFPPDLIEPCILAGCPEGGTVLDPFGGAGTTGLVADRHHRSAILIELNPEYAEMAKKRIFGDAPLFTEVETLAIGPESA